MKILVLMQVIVALNASNTISVDGVLSEAAWQAADFVTFANISRSDNQAKVSVLWDSTSLYFGFEITDSQLQTDGTNVWNDDGVEIFLDTPNTKSTYDFHFILNIDGELVWEGTDQITFKTVLEGAGYKTEIAVPWAEMPVTPVAGKVLGGIFGFNERDGTTSSQVDWLGILESGNYRQPHLWGDIEISGRTADGPPSPPTNVTVSWDPNPEDDLSGYNLYRGLQPRNSSGYAFEDDVGNVLSQRYRLAEGFTYYFAVTARDNADNESEYSEEVALFLMPPQRWAKPRLALLADTTGVTRDSLATMSVGDTLEVGDALWSFAWKNDDAIAIDEWDIDEADSLVYRFRAVGDTAYETVVFTPDFGQMWILQPKGGIVYEMSVAAYKFGGEATFSDAVYFRQREYAVIILQHK